MVINSMVKRKDGGTEVVVAIRPSHRARGRCSCGWVGPLRVLLASAKVDALVHAASRGCEPAIPLVQPEVAIVFNPPRELTVACPAGCGATIPVELVIADSVPGGFSGGFTAEAPDLHDQVYKHLRTCAAGRSWVDAALHEVTTARPRLRSARTR
jgi:hypothetical protein